MPSIALFVKQLLAEPLNGTKFTAQIDDRIKDMNAAQLQGMYSYLEKASKAAKSDAWRNANLIIMQKMKPKLDRELVIATFEQKMYDEIVAKEQNKADLRESSKREAARVQEMITQKAYKEAREEVNENEIKRQALEKTIMITQLFEREDVRNKRFAILAAVCVVSIVVVSVVISVLGGDVLIMVGVIFFIVAVTALAGYKIYIMSLVFPKIVPEEELERQREEIAVLLRKKAMDGIRANEQKFREAQLREKVERRRIREERRQAGINAAKLVEERRLEHIRMATEIKERNSAVASLASSQSSLVVPVSLSANSFARPGQQPAPAAATASAGTANNNIAMTEAIYNGASRAFSSSLIQEHKDAHITDSEIDNDYRIAADLENQLDLNTDTDKNGTNSRGQSLGLLGSRGVAYIDNNALLDDNNSVSSLEMGSLTGEFFDGDGGGGGKVPPVQQLYYK